MKGFVPIVVMVSMISHAHVLVKSRGRGSTAAATPGLGVSG